MSSPDHFDSLGDFYDADLDPASDPLMSALERWDHDAFVPLRAKDPELYGLIVKDLGREIDILLGEGSVKLGFGDRQITLTWNGDDEDLLDLVLEGWRLIAAPPGS